VTRPHIAEMERAIQPATKRNRCAEYSRAAEEEMAGSVKAIDLWLLIEYRARWDREAITVFPQAVQERLRALRSTVPKMRLALMRQTGRDSGPLTIFWAFSRERRPRLYRAEFSNYEELSFDVVQSGGESAEKVFAVCTHGTHDLCCAQFGHKIYTEMRALSENVWHVSHIGGCRFAPNVVCLPHGIVYGRVERSDCAAIVSGYKEGALLPSKLRGRSCYSKPVQAAEQFLRSAKQLTDLEALNVTRVAETQPGQWSITFLARDSIQHQVSLTVEGGWTSTYKSCSVSQLSPRERFRLIDVV
jgi:hypothetical protein